MKKYFATEYVSQHFKRLLEWNNLPHIRFRDLRHSCASILLFRGFTLKDVQKWLVHSDIERKKLLRILRQIYLLNLLEKVLDTVFFYSAFIGIKKEEPRFKSEVLAGDPSGIRTPDTLIKSQVLCQLS